MLFRPSFCCNCGEKIERAEWKLWTSRKFCDLCATDFTLQEFLPKGVIILASIISVFGVVSFFRRGPGRADLVASKAIARPTQNAAVNTGNSAPVQLPQAVNSQVPTANVIANQRPQTLAPLSAAPKLAVETAEAVYICGAATKKGTPCSRRVKGNVRCWQHVGQPAMLPPDQLRVSR